MRDTLTEVRGIMPFVLFGSVVGVLIIHPVAMAASWFEVSMNFSLEASSLLEFVRERFWFIFQLHLLPMVGIYVVIGGTVGLRFGLFSAALHREARSIQYFEGELARNIPSLIATGESERVEFKVSVRAGNSTRELNVREAMSHAASRWLTR